ncbi:MULTISPECIES: hypothetical protein [unclassified Cryobacterium]|uniref:hypothetical protein n=1 Tax=unclassified Cryobacterium TaxID=2649013 RepID=UPI000CE498C4|nr:MULTISPECIES: hypothetical protein [unclassified Cryobacterium]
MKLRTRIRQIKARWWVLSGAVGTVGAVSSELTEITSGVTAGDTVILADLNAAIASSEPETESGLAGLGGDTSTEPGAPPASMGGPPAG